MSIQINEVNLKELLPDVVVEIIELIGFEYTLELIGRLGGVDFAMPKGEANSEREALLVSIIGRNATDIMMQVYGGARLYIPCCSNTIRQLRNQQFVNMIDMAMASGSSKIKAIQLYAPQFGITERHAYDIIKKQNKGKQIEISYE